MHQSNAAVSEGQPPEGVPPDAEGWLWKAGERHTAYKRRWFQLDGETRTLRYFVDEKHATKQKEKGHIDLTGLSKGDIKPVPDAAKDFEIVTKKRTFRLRADGDAGEAEAGRWQKVLKSLVVGSRQGRGAAVEATPQHLNEANATGESVTQNPKQGDASGRKTVSGLCTDLLVTPVSPWTARDTKPSHILGYDSPGANSLGYLGAKGRVPSHRLRYRPK